MHSERLRRFLRRPGTAAALMCLAFGLGFFLGAWSFRQRSGDTVTVTSGEAVPASAERTAAVDINTATASELERLPGIGPALAARIVEYREENGPFAYCYELTDVSGIGSSTYEGLKELITVGPRE